MEIFYSVVRFFTAGGVFMLPILAVGAVGCAIAVERYITITRMRVKNRALWAQIEPAIMAGEFDKAREITGKSETALSRLLEHGLAMQGAVRRRDDVKEAMEESMMEILPQLEKRTHYLATFANLATLARPARHGQRSDPRVRRSCDREPGREGEPALGEYLGGHELHGLRPDGRRADAVRARVPADEVESS